VPGRAELGNFLRDGAVGWATGIAYPRSPTPLGLIAGLFCRSLDVFHPAKRQCPATTAMPLSPTNGMPLRGTRACVDHCGAELGRVGNLPEPPATKVPDPLLLASLLSWLAATVTATTMLLDSGHACIAVTAIAGLGGRVGGGVSSSAASRAVATASTVVLSAGLNSVAQSSATSGFDPENFRAESGTDFCAPVESVNEIGAVPTTSTAALATIASPESSVTTSWIVQLGRLKQPQELEPAAEAFRQVESLTGDLAAYAVRRVVQLDDETHDSPEIQTLRA
jgi:hypothetical protein